MIGTNVSRNIVRGRPFAKRRGGLSAYKSKMAFWSGDLDFDNLKWLDQTGNTTGADLVETACVEIKADVTITTTTALTGKTVAKVNESADNIAGVSVSGADLCIDFSELVVTDNKIWSIELDDGQLFILQSVASPYIFADGNMGTIGGTEDTEWSHSTSDSAFPYHLRDGFSKYPYANVRKNAFREGYPNCSETDIFEIEWEGYNFISTTSALFTLPFKILGYAPVVMHSGTNQKIYMLSRYSDVGSFITTSTFEDKHLKLKLKYIGGGFNSFTNWELYVNDIKVLTEYQSPLTLDRTDVNCWAGSGYGDTSLAVINYSLTVNNQKHIAIKDGELRDYWVYSLPTGYIHIPVFDSLDAFNLTPTNIAYSNKWNYSETKLKMPVSSGISDNDVNNILYTNPATPNSLELNTFYPQFGNKIHCDNATQNALSNLIVTTEELDLYKYLNGYVPEILAMSMRSDTSGSNDVRSALYDDVVDELSMKADAHMFSPAFNDKWGALIESGNIAVALHDIIPSFYKYANYYEGKKAYDAATTDEKTNGTVIENMGKIGYSFSEYATPLERFEFYVTNFGFEYPEGVTPDADDDNEMWWQWWIDQFKLYVESHGGKLSSFSYLGAFPTGIHSLHPDFISIIETAIYGDISGVDVSDDLGNDVMPGVVLGDVEIATEDTFKCVKLDASSSSAYININLGDWQYHRDNVFDISFLAKGSSNLPIKSIKIGNEIISQIGFGENITLPDSVSSTNVCVVDTWYKIRIISSGNQLYILVYNSSGECVLTTRPSSTTDFLKGLLITVDSGVSFIRDINIKSYLRNRSLYSFVHVKYDADSGENTAEEWSDILKEEAINNLFKYGVFCLFSHQIRDTQPYNDDGTYEGVMDRSYITIKSIFEYFKNLGVKFTNSYDLNTIGINQRDISGRRNLIINSDLEDEKLGFSGSVFGTTLTKAETETSNNSIDGSNVCELGATDYVISVNTTAGTKRLKFWAKGNFRLYITNEISASTYYTGVYNVADYTFFNIPIDVFSQAVVSITFNKIGTTYLHKIVLEQ